MSGWAYLCDVDLAGLDQLLAGCFWPPVKGGQPNRLRAPSWTESIIQTVLDQIGPGFDCYRPTACLSRLVPGATYEMHRDPQPPGWLTRVHVPLATNPGAWIEFAGEERVHFALGRAYVFDMSLPHNYGNDGDSDRVHLIIDIVQR